jgi:hypothetical protein
VWELREFGGGTLAVGGAIFPVVPLICRNCGNTLFLNAVIANAVPPARKEGVPHGEK